MIKQEALELLKTAPQGDRPSRVNVGITQELAVRIIRKGVDAFPDGAKLSRLFEKRVWQVVKNQVRPRF